MSSHLLNVRVNLQYGLVRQYLKKGSCFAQVTDSALIHIINNLNNRPKKA